VVLADCTPYRASNAVTGFVQAPTRRTSSFDVLCNSVATKPHPALAARFDAIAAFDAVSCVSCCNMPGRSATPATALHRDEVSNKSPLPNASAIAAAAASRLCFSNRSLCLGFPEPETRARF